MRLLELNISRINLRNYLIKQLNYMFPDEKEVAVHMLDDYISKALFKIRRSFDTIRSKYYQKKNKSYFDYLNGDHYAVFLYWVSNIAFNEGQISLAKKMFLLNKCMFGLDLFYEINMPDIFIMVHPLGSVVGRAKFSDFLVIYQGVTIGSTSQGVYPEFAEKIVLYSNTSVIGRCYLKENVVLGSNATLINQEVDSDKVVLGHYPNNKVLENKNNIIGNFFFL